MRGMRINQKNVYYSLLVSEQAHVDANGLKTGLFTKTYGTPVLTKMALSGAHGNAIRANYGIDKADTQTLTTCDMSCPIELTTLLWLDLPAMSPYDDEAEYSAGDYCIYGNDICKALTDVQGVSPTESQWAHIPPTHLVIAEPTKTINSITYHIKGAIMK